MSATADIPHFPPELVDLFVDDVARLIDSTERTHGLASLALVSHALRRRAHYHLFSSVELLGAPPNYEEPDKHLLTRVQELSELIEADPDSDISGLASHIRSLKITYHYPDNKICSKPLATVLRKLFHKACHEDLYHPTSCSLSVNLGYMVDWKEVDEDLVSALWDVIQQPRLSTICLHGLQNIPRHILKNTHVSNVFLDGLVTLAPSEHSNSKSVAAVKDRQTLVLEALSMKGGFPILELLDVFLLDDTAKNIVFSKLKHLYIFTVLPENTETIMQILDAASGSLQTLHLHICHPVRPLPLSSLSKLRSLVVSTTEMTARPESTFWGITTLLQELPSPTFHFLELQFVAAMEPFHAHHLSSNPYEYNGQEHVYEPDQYMLLKSHCALLDDFLGQSKFRNLKVLRILCHGTFDGLRIYTSCGGTERTQRIFDIMKVHEVVLRDYFPKLGERMKKGDLKMEVRLVALNLGRREI